MNWSQNFDVLLESLEQYIPFFLYEKDKSLTICSLFTITIFVTDGHTNGHSNYLTKGGPKKICSFNFGISQTRSNPPPPFGALFCRLNLFWNFWGTLCVIIHQKSVKKKCPKTFRFGQPSFPFLPKILKLLVHKKVAKEIWIGLVPPPLPSSLCVTSLIYTQSPIIYIFTNWGFVISNWG